MRDLVLRMRLQRPQGLVESEVASGVAAGPEVLAGTGEAEAPPVVPPSPPVEASAMTLWVTPEFREL